MSAMRTTVRRAEDAALVNRVREGEVEAFQALYLSQYRPLVGFANAYVHSFAQAEELVQDVFAAVWERRHTWEAPGGPVAYLFAAVRNRALHVLEHERIAGRIAHNVESDTAVPAMGTGPLAPDSAVEYAELRRAVAKAIAQLPRRRRVALALRTAHGMSYAEIAEALGVSVNSAMLLVSRARESIAPLLVNFAGDFSRD